MSAIIGRDPEIEILNRIVQSTSAEFVAVYGRRRVGKTYLINNYFKDKGVYFELTGTKKSSRMEQLKNFHREYSALFVNKPYHSHPKDWGDAFHRLINAIADIRSQQKIIIFLDELPWLAAPRSGFLTALEYSWNRHLSRIDNVILVICGSAASWMIKHIIENKAGLFGRLSAKIPLYPFDLSNTEKYLQSRHVVLTRKQMVEVVMAVGGVGKYLSYIQPGLSVPQIINELYFTAHGQLFLEFNRLFQSLFEHAEKHIQIVIALSKKRYGLMQSELLKLAKLPQSGSSTVVLRELEESGFIMRVPMFGKVLKEHKYRLIDEFSYFYLQWVQPHHQTILSGSDVEHWQKIYYSPAWQAWAGYAFENICLKHIKKIKASLGIGAVITQESHWYADGNSTEDGAEIDLIIDRSDGCINLCEIKFCSEQYTITKQYAGELIRKKERFRALTQTRKAIFMTMITPYGLKQNNYSNELIQSDVILEDLF